MRLLAGLESRNEHVRARPRFDATLGGALGMTSWALGLAEVLRPRAVARWLGLGEGSAHLVRTFGLREIGSGVGLLQNPVGPQFAWARVAGDVMDLMSLQKARRLSSRPGRVTLAICVVGLITVLDVAASLRLSQVAAEKRVPRIAK
jgi:hypothetical protein